jgi:type II secretory pathway pseudopilin PulG
MNTKSQAGRSLLTILAVALIGGLAAVVLLGASRTGASRSDAGVCQASLAVYEQALDRAERASDRESNAEALAAARQVAYEAYTDCVRLAAFSSAAALDQTPPPTFARPPLTPPGHRGTPPPVQPPRGTPRFTPPGPPLTPPMRMTPPGPRPTHGRPPFTPPGPPMTPPGHMPTPPGPPPITPPGHG